MFLLTIGICCVEMANPDNEYELIREVLGDRVDLFMNENQAKKMVEEIKEQDEKNIEHNYPLELELPIRPMSPPIDEAIELQIEVPEQKDFAKRVMDLFKDRDFYQMYDKKTETSVTWIYADTTKNVEILFCIEQFEQSFKLTIINNQIVERSAISNSLDYISQLFIVYWCDYVPQGGKIL